MASSSFPVGTAVKFWVPNLGARVPVDLSTGLPDYSEYVRSGLWVQRRRLRVCDGTGLTAYMPEGDRSWPDTFPVSNMKIYQTYCHMEGVTQEKVLNPLNALEILEGQVALVHHIMAFEEANPAVHVLSPRQKWKATFLAYFLGAVSQGQLTIMKQLGDEAYAASLADRNCWQVRTSKRLTYLLRHSKQTSLGRHNDALFENIDRDLQAFRWAPHKILGFLLGNTNSRFTVHVQLRRLHYDDVPSIDWYISLSAVQGHSRVSDVADPSTLGEPLTLDRCRALGYIFHATHNKNWEGIRDKGLALGHTREEGQSSRLAIHMVYAGGSEAPKHGTHIQYGRYIFYYNVKYEELLHEGGALFLADNGVVLSYNTIPAKYLTFHTRPPHEKDPAGRQWERRAREEGVPMGTGSSEARATGGSPMGEGPGPSSSSAAGGSAFAEEPDAAVGTPTFNLDDLRRVIQEQELAEQTESEGRRIPKEEGVLEVDAKISLERERILEQEALIQKMNANPWFIYEQGVTRLKWPSGAYVVSEYGDGRVKTTSWVEVPDKLRRSLIDIGPETWICHPFSGFSVYFFLKAHELGKWQGNLLMEMEKERVYTRLDDQGNPRTGYKSGFGDIPDLLYTNQSLIDAEFRDEDSITFRKPTPKDKHAKKPSPTNMSDEDYATAMEDHRFYLHQLDVYREFAYIRKDFQFIVSCFSELYGDELFNYLRVNQDNHELRKRFVLALDNGDCVFDCSLREPFNSRLIIEKIKKRWSELEVSARNFASHFARKAFNDLAEYDFVKAKHADRLQDLLDRPYEDILAEETIDSLPSCTVVEEMEVEKQPTPSPAPAEEAGDLVLEDEQAYHQANTDIMLDGPPVYTSKEALSILTVNLGNFVRGRKKTVPEKFAAHVDRKDYNGVGPLVKSLARSNSHIACVLEASNVDIEEVAYLVRHGWYMQSNMGRGIMIMARTNQAYESIEHLAGPMCEPEVHQYLPLSYWVVEIRYGKCPSAAAIRKTGSNLQDCFSRNHMEDDIERCGMPVFRVCVFHMSAKVASKKPALMHEAMGVMLADCFHFQVDYITGDANMAGYRTGGSKQGSSSIRDSCFQEMVRYYLKAYTAAQNGDPYCCPRAKFTTSNPLTLLRWMEDKFGIPWKDVGAVDWENVPGLDCMVACILEWSHSIPNWRYGSKPRTLSTSTRFVSPNGCFAATEMSICFRRPTATLTLLSLFT